MSQKIQNTFIIQFYRNGVNQMKYSKEKLQKKYKEEDCCFFWSHRPSKDNVVTETCLSQWWKCSFTENNIQFCCAEQYMMYKKAILFKDYECARKILQCNDPRRIKSYGRIVANFDEKIWDAQKYQIVLEGNILKFSQNETLYHFLMQTGNKILVEASPYDKIWGIGMGKEAAERLEPAKWNGENLLGFALMETRDRIARR